MDVTHGLLIKAL